MGRNKNILLLVRLWLTPYNWFRWLEPIDQAAERFTDTAPAEEDGLEGVGLNLSLRYDWGKNELSYRLLRDDADTPVERFEVSQPAGPHFFSVDRPRSGHWVTCPRVTRAASA